MSLNIDWGTFNAGIARTDIPGAFQRGFDQGMARREKMQLQSALAAYANNPNDPDARRTIYTLNPQLGASLEDQAFQQSERRREGEFRSAFGDYMSAAPQPTQNALAPFAPPRRDAPLNVTADNFQQGITAGTSPASRMPAQGMMGSAQNALAPTMPEMVAAPASDPRLAARNRALRAAPDKFLTYEGKRIEVDSKRLEQLRDLNDSAMQILGGVYDDATLQAGKARALAMYRQFGVPTETIEQLPDTYSPELVRSLQMQGMDTAKQLAAVARENRLEWDIQDDLYDNERADLNTESVIETREEQLANVRRGQDLTNSRGLRGQDLTNSRAIRGQDLTDSRGRRGQDLTDQRGRRGQDITDRRGRDSASFRGRGGKGSVATARIVNPQTGQEMVLKNGKWVPER